MSPSCIGPALAPGVRATGSQAHRSRPSAQFTPSLLWLGLLGLLGACTASGPRTPDADSPYATSTPAAPHAGVRGAARAPAEGDRSIAIGVGTTYGPDTFLLTGDADFYQSDRLAIGPSLQLGVHDDAGIIAPSCHVKFVFPIERKSDDPLFMPFVQGGAGLCWIQKDRPGDDDGLGFLLQAGGGLEVRFDERYALASTLLINILPAEVVDEHAYLSWQIVQFSFRF
jgi:hypothetical protein